MGDSLPDIEARALLIGGGKMPVEHVKEVLDRVKADLRLVDVKQMDEPETVIQEITRAARQGVAIVMLPLSLGARHFYEAISEQLPEDTRRSIQFLFLYDVDTSLNQDQIELSTQRGVDTLGIPVRKEELRVKILRTIQKRKNAEEALSARRAADKVYSDHKNQKKESDSEAAFHELVLDMSPLPIYISDLRKTFQHRLSTAELEKLHTPKEQKKRITTSLDWTVNRSPEELAGLSGVSGFDILHETVRIFITKKTKRWRNFPFVSACVGMGDGSVLRKLKQLIPSFFHCGIGQALEFKPEVLLERAIKEEYQDEAGLKYFVRDLSEKMLTEKGLQGRLTIDPDNPVDQRDFKEKLYQMAESPSVISEEASKKRVIKRIMRPNEFESEKEGRIPESAMNYFEEFVKDPAAFFAKYFHSALQLDSSEDLSQLLPQQEELNVLFSDFTKMNEALPNRQMYSVVHDNRSLSHLKDHDYLKAISEFAKRLVPGGVVLSDGIKESYTRFLRVGLIRKLETELNQKREDYKFYLIGDDEGPKSLFVQRGVRRKKRKSLFLTKAQRADIAAKGHKIVPLEDFEVAWPELYLQNKVIERLKPYAMELQQLAIVDKKLRVDIYFEWRKRFQDIHPELTKLFKEEFMQEEIKSMKSSAFYGEREVGQINQKIEHLKGTLERRQNEVIAIESVGTAEAVGAVAGNSLVKSDELWAQAEETEAELVELEKQLAQSQIEVAEAERDLEEAEERWQNSEWHSIVTSLVPDYKKQDRQAHLKRMRAEIKRRAQAILDQLTEEKGLPKFALKDIIRYNFVYPEQEARQK